MDAFPRALASALLSLAAATAGCGDVVNPALPDAADDVAAVDAPVGPDDPDAGSPDAAAPVPGVSWAMRYGGPQGEDVTSLLLTPAGEVVSAGRFAGTITVGSDTLVGTGTSSAAIARLDGDTGAPIDAWAVTSTGQVEVTSLSVAGTGLVYGGLFTGTIALPASNPTAPNGVSPWDGWGARVTSTGSPTWAKTFGDGNLDIWRSDTDAAGHVVLGGEYAGSINLGGATLSSPTYALALASFDAAGAHRWSRSYGGGCNVVPITVAVDPLGDIVVAGFLQGNGCTTNLGGADLTLTDDADVFVARYDGDGHHVFSRRIGGPGTQREPRLAITSDRHVVVVGTTGGAVHPDGGVPLPSAGGVDGFVVRYDTAGNLVFGRTLGGVGDDGDVVGVALGDDDTIFAAISLAAPGADLGGGMLGGAGGLDVALVALDGDDGAHRWSTGFGGAGDDRARALAVAGDRLVVGGGFAGPSLTIGDQVLTNAGVGDAFIAGFDVGPLAP